MCCKLNHATSGSHFFLLYEDCPEMEETGWAKNSLPAGVVPEGSIAVQIAFDLAMHLVLTFCQISLVF